MAFQILNNNIVVAISTANPNLDGSGTITTLFTAGGTYGSVLEQIRIQSVGAVSTGMIRLFIQASGTGSFFLIKEIPVPVTPGSTPPFTVFATTIDAQISLRNSWVIGVTTENADSFVVSAFGYDITGFI